VRVRRLRDDERGWVRSQVEALWGARIVVAHRVVYEPASLEGFVAEDGGRPVGLLTYLVEDDACEIVTIDAFEPGRGIGTALLDAVKALGHRRLWLVTTNDNVRAQRFYERSGFRLVAVREGEIERSRRLKPQIPGVGEAGVPIRDELEYEFARYVNVSWGEGARVSPLSPGPEGPWRSADAGSTVSDRRA
jgi:ribosomal protein S18 acetylase RimI-like enzyme